MKKTSKPFIVSDESINCYKIVLSTKGLDWSGFEKNPVMLFNHNYDKVLGQWDYSTLSIKDDIVTLFPLFDEADEYAMNIFSKVEQDIIKMCSISVLPDVTTAELRNDDGNDYVFVAKSLVKEISITPLGGNHNAFRLVNAENKEIKLSDASTYLLTQKPQKKDNMKDVAKILKLSEGSDETTIVSAIIQLQDDASYKSKYEELLSTAKAEQKNKFIELINTARIEPEEKAIFLKMYDTSPDLANELLSKRKANHSISEFTHVGQSTSADDVVKLSAEYDKLDRTGKLVSLRDSNHNEFSRLFKAKFGVEPNKK